MNRSAGTTVSGSSTVRSGVGRWVNDLTLGARLAIAGGRDGRVRTALAAIGVGLGVALLLICVSIPNMLAQRHERGAQRDFLAIGGAPLARAENTALITEADSEFHDIPIRGIVIQADGVQAPVPPGLPTLPGAGQLVLSPALADLLASPDGAALRDRFPGHVVGTIADQGLAGPAELAYYLGADNLATGQVGVARIDHFGETSSNEGLDPVLMLLVVVIFVVLLLPIGIFVAAAVRFGGERRDRRLAAVRLVGADGAMARRIAAGEALLSAIFGLLAGVVFYLVGRQLIEHITLQNLSVFAADVRPGAALAGLIAVAVPVAAVAVTLFSLRRVIIEPLGVVRQTRGVRRRLWWRLVLPLIGLALLYPLIGDISRDGGRFNQYEVVAGVTLLLLGTASLLPWLVQAVVRRLGGGGVSWQLAIRRLQLDSNTSARAVTGIAVAAAGAIALQMLFSAAGARYHSDTGQDPTRAQIVTDLSLRQATFDPEVVRTKLLAASGVRSLLSVRSGDVTVPPAADATDDGRDVSLIVGGCAELGELATVPSCADGESFVFAPEPATPGSTPIVITPGQPVRLGEVDSAHELSTLPQWTIPADARTVTPRPDPSGQIAQGIYLTPRAAAAAAQAAGTALPITSLVSYLRVDPGAPDVVERVRNAAAGISPTMQVQVLRTQVTAHRFADIQRGLFIGAFATLLLIGASLLVSMVEQLRDRRRLLAALVAFGTRRSTLSWSVLWQAAVPVTLGMVLAVAAGTGLGALLLRMVGTTVRFDWQIVGGVCASALAVVVAVTALSLPALWRLLRPEGLRTE